MATNDETIPIEDALKEIRDGLYLKSDSWSNEEVAKVVELYYKKGSTEARADERAKVEEDFLSTDLINTETYKRNITKARSDTAKQLLAKLQKCIYYSDSHDGYIHMDWKLLKETFPELNLQKVD